MGDSVRVRLGRAWTPGNISSKHNTPRSYLVTTESGREYRKSRRVINRTPEPPPDVSSLDDFGIPPGPSTNKLQQAGPEAPTAPTDTQAPDAPRDLCRTSGRARRKPGWMSDYDTS